MDVAAAEGAPAVYGRSHRRGRRLCMGVAAGEGAKVIRSAPMFSAGTGNAFYLCSKYQYVRRARMAQTAEAR